MYFLPSWGLSTVGCCFTQVPQTHYYLFLGPKTFFSFHHVIDIYGAFTPNVKSGLNENLGGILGDTQC
jgi:hypothetical protein